MSNLMKCQGGVSSYQRLTFPFFTPEQYAQSPERSTPPAFTSFAHGRKAPYYQLMRVWKEEILRSAFYSTDEECYELLATWYAD